MRQTNTKSLYLISIGKERCNEVEASIHSLVYRQLPSQTGTKLIFRPRKTPHEANRQTQPLRSRCQTTLIETTDQLARQVASLSFVIVT